MATAAEVPVAGTADIVQDTNDKLSLPALTAMVVGSMVGAGVFQLPARFATQTGSMRLIAWAIAGLACWPWPLFSTLAVRKPQLDNGVYVYARAGFGVYPVSSPPSASGPPLAPETPSTGC